jgi:hypothetical protein
LCASPISSTNLDNIIIVASPSPVPRLGRRISLLRPQRHSLFLEHRFPPSDHLAVQTIGINPTQKIGGEKTFIRCLPAMFAGGDA